MKKQLFFVGIFLLGFVFSAYGYTLLSGKEISLADLVQAAKKEILFFYSTRCPYCIQEIKVLNSNCSYLEAQGYKIFFIALPDSEKRLTRYRELLKLKCPIVMDDGSLMSLYGVLGVPTYIFLYNGKPFGMANSMDVQAIEDVYQQEKKR